MAILVNIVGRFFLSLILGFFGVFFLLVLLKSELCRVGGMTIRFSEFGSQKQLGFVGDA